MPASRIAHIARIQSKATGHSYNAVLHQLVERNPNSGLLPAIPSPEQQELEALFINKLETMYVERSEKAWSRLNFGVKRLHAETKQLTVFLSPSTSLTHLAVQLLPVITSPGADAEVHGIPGLRATAHPLGLCLYRPGIDARIVLAGITAEEFEQAHHAGFSVPHSQVRCAATAMPDEWAIEERTFAAYYGSTLGAASTVESALLRRICLFSVQNPKSVRTWHNLPGGICVELSFEAFSLDQFDELLAMLTSPYLNPPMALQSRHYNVEDNWGRITLSCAGTEQEIEIRTTLR